MSVSLQMIVKDEVGPVWDLVCDAIHYFDDIYLTVSDKPAANKLKKLVKTDIDQPDKIHVDWREWTDNFADARNHNWKLGEGHDYSFWLDADDSFDFGVIPGLVQLADDRGVDAIYLPYNYAQDDTGRCVARHWRERLIRRAHPFEWRGAVHETLISDVPYKQFHAKNEIRHQSQNFTASLDRNHEILRKNVEEKSPVDPRDMVYYGFSLSAKKEYQKSIDILSQYVEASGWDEEIYRAFCNMSESAYHLGKHGQATEFAMKALAMYPAYPQAYWLMAQYENDQNNYPEALEWVKSADTKPIPQTMAVVDPTCVDRNRIVGAQACFMLGRYTDALKWLLRSNDPAARDLLPEFQQMAETETFFKVLPTIRSYFRSDKALWNALDDEIKTDTRARGLRNAAVTPKTWGNRSIVFFCGQGYEEWGPHTLDKGMGGSEEAIIYLARELSKKGWQVDVFGEVPQLITDEVGDSPTVLYHPWKEFDERDHYNVFVSWRTPVFTSAVDAKVKVVDVHDVMPTEIMKDIPDATYFVKSDYHRNLYPHLPDEKFQVIGNGIDPEHFDGN